MIDIKPKIKMEIESSCVTSDGRDVNDIIEDICSISHDALEYASVARQDLEELIIKSPGMSAKQVQNRYLGIIEYLEGHFCEILEKLDD